MAKIKINDFRAVLVLAGFVVLAAWAITDLSNRNLKSQQDKYLTCRVIYKRDVQVRANKTVFYAEIADSPELRERGLSGRECIEPDQAMLFVFNEPGQYGFWMKDMKFSIDMVWLDAGGKVVKIQPNVAPSTYPDSFTNDQPALYVLELPAGRTSELKIENGTKIELVFGA